MGLCPCVPAHSPLLTGGWDYGNCTVGAGPAGSSGLVQCRFSSQGNISYANATVEGPYCNELAHWTHNFSEKWVKLYKHESCQSFVVNTTCKPQPTVNYTGCPGGCDDPNSCVNCAMRYNANSHGYYEGLSNGVGERAFKRGFTLQLPPIPDNSQFVWCLRSAPLLAQAPIIKLIPTL